jgi:acetolactate synthase-1/2/3 large subunit
VGATEELQPRIKACLEEPGVHLIDVPVDYSLNDQTLNVAIKERSKAI